MITRKIELNQTHVNGILPIDKPHGLTSTEVVRQIKKAVSQKKVGHAGPLDPFATGVLPIHIGQATRLTEFLMDSQKEYSGLVELGVETNTYDSFGEITLIKSTKFITYKDVQLALDNFSGRIKQTPPIYSALKRNGRRLYEMARLGEEVIVEPRFVDVFEIKLESYEEPFATVFVKCGKGFYMRSLAHDIGQILGVGGHLKDLRRTRTGPFSIKDCYPLEDACNILNNGDYKKIVRCPDSILKHLKKVVIDKNAVKLVQTGQSLSTELNFPVVVNNELIRAYTPEGKFIALLKYEDLMGRWFPKKVFDLA